MDILTLMAPLMWNVEDVEDKTKLIHTVSYSR